MNLTPSEMRLLLHFLEDYDERLSNDGCNDFPEFSELMPDAGERDALLKFFHEENGDPENYERGRKWVPNHVVLSAVVFKLKSRKP